MAFILLRQLDVVHDLDFHTDVTITSVGDHNRLSYDIISGKWINVPSVPPPPPGASLVSQLLWGPIAAISGTTIIPGDLSVPLITEGTELWTQDLSIVDITSTVKIGTNCTTSASSAAVEFVFAVFRDSVCIGTAVNATANVDSGFAMSFEMFDLPNQVGNVTYSVRVGKSGGGGTWSINEIGGEILFGGTMENNSYSVEEITVAT